MSDFIREEALEKSCVSAEIRLSGQGRSCGPTVSGVNEEEFDQNSGYIGGDEWSFGTANGWSADSSVQGRTDGNLVPLVQFAINAPARPGGNGSGLPAPAQIPGFQGEGGADSEDVHHGDVDQQIDLHGEEDRESTTGDGEEDNLEEVQSNLKRRRVYAYGRSMRPRNQ